MILTDSHAHLSYVAERLGSAAVDEVLSAYAAAWSEASEAGRSVPLLLDPGVEAGDLLERLTRFGERPFLRYAAGIWPGKDALVRPRESLSLLERSIGEAEGQGLRVSAIGECGLDYHHLLAPPAVQAELFSLQIRLARRLGLPLIVHSRDAADDTLSLLTREAGGLSVIIHCFGYGPREAEAFVREGCWISFAGNLSYKAASPLREALVAVPGEKLLLETDAPYMNPEPRRGRPSTPLDVERTYALAAELRGAPVSELGELVARNAALLFGPGRTWVS